MAMSVNHADRAISMLQDYGYNADYEQEPRATFFNPMGLVNVVASKEGFHRTFWSLGEVQQFCNRH